MRLQRFWKRSALLAVLTMLSAQTARADYFTPSFFFISELIHASELNAVYIKHNLTSFTNAAGCAQSAYFVLYEGPTSGGPNYKAKMPFLMAAYLAGKPIQIGYLGCHTNGYPLVTQVIVGQP